MVAAHRPKPPDKQELCRKVTSLLKKAYHASTPRHDLPVLESLLYAICFEDAASEAADVVYKRLMTTFPDLNEARVSSIAELQAVFHDQEAAAWRALRVKNTLQFAFDNNYSFELEGLKRKTVELAVKHLGRIPSLSWFVRGWALQNALGSHVLPIDSRMHAALLWMGLVEHDADPEQSSESLRPYIRKADAQQFCQLLKALSLDPKRSKAFWPAGKGIEYSYNADEGVHRLEVLLTRGPASVPKPTSTKPAPSAAKLKSDAAKAEAAKPEPAKVEPVKSGSGKSDAHHTAGKSDHGKPTADKSGGAKSGATKAPPAKSTAVASPAKSVALKPTGGKSDSSSGHGKGSISKPAGKSDGKREAKPQSKGNGKKRP